MSAECCFWVWLTRRSSSWTPRKAAPRAGHYPAAIYASALYLLFDAFQVAASVGYRLSQEFRLDLKGVFIDQDLRLGPIARTSSTSAGTATLSYAPNDRFFASLLAWVGDRQFAVDAEGLYAFNVRDVSRRGWSLLTTYRLRTPLRLFARYTHTPFTVQPQDFAPAERGRLVFGTDEAVGIASLGLDYFF